MSTAWRKVLYSYSRIEFSWMIIASSIGWLIRIIQVVRAVESACVRMHGQSCLHAATYFNTLWTQSSLTSSMIIVPRRFAESPASAPARSRFISALPMPLVVYYSYRRHATSLWFRSRDVWRNVLVYCNSFSSTDVVATSQSLLTLWRPLLPIAIWVQL